MEDEAAAAEECATPRDAGSSLLASLDGMSQALWDTLDEAVSKIEGKQAQERVLEKFAENVPAVFDETAERIVATLRATASNMLAEYAALDAAQAAEVQERWGDALAAYRTLWVSSHEVGEAFSRRHFTPAGVSPSAMVHAQIGLQARACRVGSEVFALLRAGLGAGALARSRTLQEIATISTVLAQHGGPDGDHPDLAERYLRHADVVSWIDAVEYQEVAPKLGYAPLSAAEMDELQEPRDEAVARYGDAFGKPNGWAARVMRNQKAPRFKDLEVLASADHMRMHYSWASHEVHADAKSWVMNHETIGDVTYRNTGPSSRGMADAGQLALMALTQVTENALYSAPDVAEHPADIIAVMVLDKLLDRAWVAFSKADGA
ncbi:DUF5677 domain-containing protein [Nocardioides lacusdianchii]|uniref:DUF5677 domain-containing protein n=1 Tax=Nocardioides lacusdianchii TaxID=2783664 RepID=UPI001CC939F2|nr:DUF5677 domain-containing protein [Nocardioides lacusdianchii]